MLYSSRFSRSFDFCFKLTKRNYHPSFKRFQEIKSNSTGSGKEPTHGPLNRFKYPILASILVGSSYYVYKSDLFNSLLSPKEEEKSKSKVKAKIEDLPESVSYLLIGGGTASFAASRSIRANDPKAKVIVVTEEEYYPYMRPPLSKELFFTEKELAKNLTFKQWNGKERRVFFEHEEFYAPLKTLMASETGGVSVVKGYKVIKLDAVNKKAYLDNGQEIAYEKCLIATGGRPKNLQVFENASPSIQKKTLLFRGIDDFLKLDKASQSIKSLTIVGGGFLGSEIACALGKRAEVKKESQIINQIFPEHGNLSKALPQYLSQFTMNKVRNEGVNVVPNVDVVSVEETKDKRLKLKLNNGSTLETDYVVIAVGLEPNVDLAASAGLELDQVHGGYLVNSELQARNNIWIAGDACCFYDIKLGRRRVEHHDHAVVSGRLAGENMTGAGKPYWHQSMFWSDLGPDIGFEALGLIDSSLPTVGVFTKLEADKEENESQTTKAEDKAANEQASKKEKARSADNVPRAPDPNDDYEKGVVFYLQDDKVVGVLLWNLFNRMSIARRIINESKCYEDLSEVAKLFVKQNLS